MQTAQQFIAGRWLAAVGGEARIGTVWSNCHNRLFAEAETGGFRDSGYGRLHGAEGLNDFLQTKHFYFETNP